MCHRAGRRTAGGLVHLIDSAHIDGLTAVRLDLLDRVPVPIVDELGGLAVDGHKSEHLAHVKMILNKE